MPEHTEDIDSFDGGNTLGSGEGRVRMEAQQVVRSRVGQHAVRAANNEQITGDWVRIDGLADTLCNNMGCPPQKWQQHQSAP